MGARLTITGRGVLTLAIVAAGAYGVWRAVGAVRAGADAVGQWASDAGETVQQAGRDWVAGGQEGTRQIQDTFASATGWVTELFKPAPSVPVGGGSVQKAHAMDLPEGSYQAANMYWSKYPNDIFYDL